MLEPRSELAQVEMTAKAREHYEHFFAPKYRKFQDDVRSVPLTVLVWGPGESGGALYQKRLQIRALLRREGYAAVFSEEIDIDFPAQPGFSSKSKEFMQAISADFVVVIQASPGSIAETHDFAHFLTLIGSKMLVFIDSAHAQGYSYSGALQELKSVYGNVHQYRYPQDVEECHLATAVLERTGVLRMAKWRKGLE